MFLFYALMGLAALFGYLRPYQPQNRVIKQWSKRLRLNEHERHYQQLYQGVDGFRLSKEARATQDAIEYTYGEIEWTSFIALLSLTHPNHQSVFYDLGSGVGKAVCACAMVFNVKKSCGVELFKPLHQAAIEQQQRLREIDGYQSASRSIRFINGNFLHRDLSEATHLFINATTLFGETWDLLKQRLIQLKPNTTIITTSKQLPSDHFHLIKKTTTLMSWGPVSTFIYKKNLI
jgi:hypothetical protein